MEVEKKEDKIKAVLAISAKKASSDTPQIGGQKLGAEILEGPKEIKEMQERLITFMEYQHKWNTYMEGQYKANYINISNVPTVEASLLACTSRVKGKEVNEEQKDVRAQAAMKKKKTKRQGIHYIDPTHTA